MLGVFHLKTLALVVFLFVAGIAGIAGFQWWRENMGAISEAGDIVGGAANAAGTISRLKSRAGLLGFFKGRAETAEEQASKSSKRAADAEARAAKNARAAAQARNATKAVEQALIRERAKGLAGRFLGRTEVVEVPRASLSASQPPVEVLAPTPAEEEQIQKEMKVTPLKVGEFRLYRGELPVPVKGKPHAAFRGKVLVNLIPGTDRDGKPVLRPDFKAKQDEGFLGYSGLREGWRAYGMPFAGTGGIGGEVGASKDVVRFGHIWLSPAASAALTSGKLDARVGVKVEFRSEP